MDSFTCTLADVGAESLALVGGKGANLGELVAAGLPVPRAFVVTTHAYRHLLEANGLLVRILAELDGIDYEAAEDIERRGRAARDLITGASVPAELEAAIRTAYQQLERDLGTEVLVSVRSSATAEDLPGMSFAGQQDTYLNVAGADSLIDHVRRCWASLWTDRAIAYRHRQGFAHEDVALAVVVQEMFPARVAGVMFTANPVTSNPGELFLNASWGLGEAVVSGRVDPDQFIVDKETLAITQRDIHDKRIMIVPRADRQGSAEVAVPEAQRMAPSLTDAEIEELGTVARRIEDHYGFPQDIEWALATDGRIGILQSREITAADLDFSLGLEAWQTPEALASMTDERWVWSRAYSDEVQTGPSSPMFYTELESRITTLKINSMIWTDTTECLGYPAERFRDIPFFRWYGARAYYNLAWERERIRMFIPPFARDEAALWPFPVGEREEIRGLRFNWIRFLWIILKLHVTDPNISLLGTPQYFYENMERWTNHEAALWAALDWETATPREILETRQKAVKASGFRRKLSFTIYLYVVQAALRELLVHWCGDESHQLYGRLCGGLHTKTSEENIALWRLSRLVTASPALTSLFAEVEDVAEILVRLPETDDGPAFKDALDAFIAVYGHRGGAERDAFHPRWRHKPELVFLAVRPMLRLGDEEDPALVEEALHARMLATKRECLQTVGRGIFGAPKTAFLKWLIELTQDYVYYRDYSRFWNDRTMSIPRDMYTAIARNFIRRGLLADEEDIFFLGNEEVVDADEGRLDARGIALRVRARRRVYEKYRHREPPKYIQGWRTFDDEHGPDDGLGLRGVAASSGVVTGRARVCRTLEEVSKVEKGDILITVATDPGWTTVFSFIAGVVVETGGVVAHAVMISREYGLPCVAHLPQACDLIPDGATITVDGTNGRVIVHDDQNGRTATTS